MKGERIKDQELEETPAPEEEKKAEPVKESPPIEETPPEPPKKKEPPKTTMDLGASEGSEVHVAQLSLLNQNAAVRQIQQEVATLESKLAHLREKLGWEARRLDEERNKVIVVLSKYGVPEGWRFNRREDGTYTFYQPPAPGVPRSPMG